MYGWLKSILPAPWPKILVTLWYFLLLTLIWLLYDINEGRFRYDDL